MKFLLCDRNAAIVEAWRTQSEKACLVLAALPRFNSSSSPLLPI